MSSPSKDNGISDNSGESGYPQGKNLSPAAMSASMRKATSSLPWSHALAPSLSVFLKWPNPMTDFNRLNAISICQRPRYISSAIVALEMYRGRWQIEIAFKRLKSVIGLGHLRKTDSEGAKAWLHGKLLVAFLMEALIAAGERFFPWGYPLSPELSEIPLSLEGELIDASPSYR